MEEIRELQNGDFIDGVKELNRKGLRLQYIASLFQWKTAKLQRYLKWGHVPKWALVRFGDLKEHLESEAKDAEIKDFRDFVNRLAHYSASAERVGVNWRFPFNGFPEPEKKHVKEAEDIARAGGMPSLALELLKHDFYIKRLASYKMFHSFYRIRDFNIPNWCGLWGWLDLWADALSQTQSGRNFLKNYCRKTWRWLNRKRKVRDERSDIFRKLEQLHEESDETQVQADEPPEGYIRAKGNKISQALRSGRGEVAQYKLQYPEKNKKRY